MQHIAASQRKASAATAMQTYYLITKYFCLGLTACGRFYSTWMYSQSVSAIGSNAYGTHDSDTIELFLAHLHSGPNPDYHYHW